MIESWLIWSDWLPQAWIYWKSWIFIKLSNYETNRLTDWRTDPLAKMQGGILKIFSRRTLAFVSYFFFEKDRLFLSFYEIFADGWTDQRTDRRTDQPTRWSSYGNVRTHLDWRGRGGGGGGGGGGGWERKGGQEGERREKEGFFSTTTTAGNLEKWDGAKDQNCSDYYEIFHSFIYMYFQIYPNPGT